jgi:23S rRNA pseudouridine1911/1915/1917 synthase
MTGGTTVMEGVVPTEASGQRLDKVLASLFPPYSRSQLQQWTKQGRITICGRVPQGREPVLGGEQVRLEVPPVEPREWRAQALPLDVIHQDSDILIIDKPAGTVVHPGAGNPDGTLANAIIHHYPDLAVLPRAGLVHRIDKDTSGLLVVARTEHARVQLIRALERHAVSRIYLALVTGTPVAGGTVNAPIGRHPRDRLRMAVNDRGKPAVTHYRVKTRFRSHTLLQVELETGRTHQIRVHMVHAGYPLVGDLLYAGRLKIPAAASEVFAESLRQFKRQALHACSLALLHPRTGLPMQWSSPVPGDMKALLRVLEIDRKADR